MTRVPLVDLQAQYASIKPEIDAAVARVLRNANFILGKEVADFEQAFAKYIGVNDAVGVASGTAALHLSLLACGVGPGDEVITAAHTFIATAEAISQTGARPVFVDIDPHTYTVDPGCVEAAITPRTRAMIPVHLYGQSADMASLLDIAQRKNLWLIEDAAQAHGAEYQGRRCGSMGHLGCFSFYPGKNLGAYGDAGAVTGNDTLLLARVRKLRDHGRITKYEHDEVGFGERLDALQAAILFAKLPHLDDWIEARRAHAKTYNQLLIECDVETPYEFNGGRHVYHQYVIQTSRRDVLMACLKEHGIEVGVHYPIPLHRQPAYLQQGYSEFVLPTTERVAARVLSLPVYPELTESQIASIVQILREVA